LSYDQEKHTPSAGALQGVLGLRFAEGDRKHVDRLRLKILENQWDIVQSGNGQKL
jgi:hypothetical protein